MATLPGIYNHVGPSIGGSRAVPLLGLLPTFPSITPDAIAIAAFGKAAGMANKALTEFAMGAMEVGITHTATAKDLLLSAQAYIAKFPQYRTVKVVAAEDAAKATYLKAEQEISAHLARIASQNQAYADALLKAHMEQQAAATGNTPLDSPPMANAAPGLGLAALAIGAFFLFKGA